MTFDDACADTGLGRGFCAMFFRFSALRANPGACGKLDILYFQQFMAFSCLNLFILLHLRLDCAILTTMPLIYEPAGRAREYAALACNIYRHPNQAKDLDYCPACARMLEVQR